MKIPDWLGHLRTDRRGIPVPYVNRWGAEDVTRLSLRWDRNVGMLGVWQDDTGQSEPDFTAQHMGRQRECMTVGLCQVCGRPVPWSRRFLVLAQMSVQLVDVDNVGPQVVIHEPWLDQRCAEFALEKCPALIRRKRDEALVLVPVTSKRDARLTVSRGWIDGPLEDESRRRLPAMWVKVMVGAPAAWAKVAS